MKHILPIPGEPQIVQPSRISLALTECSVAYEINHPLDPGQAMLIDIPKSYQSRILDLITLAHRKEISGKNIQKWDPEPAFTRIIVFDNRSKSWLYWGSKQFDSVSFGDKLAEVRAADNPEIEALHDWVSYSGIIHPTKLAILNSGRGFHAKSVIHSVVIDFFPTDTDTKQLFIFSPGTLFTDLKKRNTELFGGGESYKGQYPNAVPINNQEIISYPISEYGKHFYLKDKKLHILVDHNYSFSRIEVAVGDTKDTGEFNKDGHIGTLGGAKLNIALNKNNRMQYLAEMLNVPPQGVLKASAQEIISLSPGDEFIISSQYDPAYVMGVRVQ